MIHVFVRDRRKPDTLVEVAKFPRMDLVQALHRSLLKHRYDDGGCCYQEIVFQEGDHRIGRFAIIQ